jgi:hypothetical protein
MRTGSSNLYVTTKDPLVFPQKYKSLLSNILSVSHCGSRFYLDLSQFLPDRSFRMNSLRKTVERNQTDQLGEFEANSLFQNILAVSPCRSRFYPDKPLSSYRKSFRMNILEKRRKKKSRTLHLAAHALHIMSGLPLRGSSLFRLRYPTDDNLRTPVCSSLAPNGTITGYA